MGTDAMFITSRTRPRKEFNYDRAYNFHNEDTEDVEGILDLMHKGLKRDEAKRVLADVITANANAGRNNYWMLLAFNWISDLGPEDVVIAVTEHHEGYNPEADAFPFYNPPK